MLHLYAMKRLIERHGEVFCAVHVFTDVDGRYKREKSLTLVMLINLATNEHFGSSSGPMTELTQRAALSPFSQQLSEDKRNKM